MTAHGPAGSVAHRLRAWRRAASRPCMLAGGALAACKTTETADTDPVPLRLQANAIRSPSTRAPAPSSCSIGRRRAGLTPAQRDDVAVLAENWHARRDRRHRDPRADRHRQRARRARHRAGNPGDPRRGRRSRERHRGAPASRRRSRRQLLPIVLEYPRIVATAGPVRPLAERSRPRRRDRLHDERSLLQSRLLDAAQPRRHGRRSGRPRAAARRRPRLRGAARRGARQVSQGRRHRRRKSATAKKPRSAMSENDQVPGKNRQSEAGGRRQRGRVHRAGAAGVGAGVLRDGRNRLGRPGLRGGPPPRQGPSAHADGRHRGGARGLPDLADAERGHPRIGESRRRTFSTGSTRWPMSATPARGSSSSAATTTCCSIAS